MDRFSFLERFLIDNKKNQNLKYIGPKKYFESVDNDKFLVKDGIPDFYIDDGDKITKAQKNFYEDIKFPNYNGIENFADLIDKAKKSIFAEKLDKEIPMHSRVLEAGCGTGQLSLFLSKYNRQVFSIDLSLGSLKLGESFRENNQINNVYFLRMNLFNLLFPKNFFDVIVSNGVLHHTNNPKMAFNELTKCLKKNGYIIIGLYHKYGRAFTKIRQFMIKYFGDGLKILDKRNIDRNLSSEKRYAWFNDQYKNPKESTHTYFEILEWFNDSGIEFISSIPFSYSNNFTVNNLFEKQKKINKFDIFFKELFQSFSYKQIKEGGFFIMIGKKI